jgi:two-component system, NarL family, response regulator LiaR
MAPGDKRKRVLIVDDHTAVRSGLMSSLKAFDDILPVAEVASGVEALRLCAQFQPDVVLMALTADALEGVLATHIIRYLYEKTQVIVLASFTDDAAIQTSLSAGAIGCVRKDIPANKMAEMIRTAHLGGAIQ